MFKKKCFALITALIMTVGIFSAPAGVTGGVTAGARTETSITVKDLNMSSRQAFINDVRRSYDIILSDRHGYLNGIAGRRHMRDINRCLALFSPDFIKKLVAVYAEYDSRFIIRLERPSEENAGIAEWEDDLIITLHYNKDPEENGISAGTLAHELGHAIHFYAEEHIGEAQSERELRAFNGNFRYVGDRYEEVWNERRHGTTFAYDYAMYSYYEDIACIFEMLVKDPDGMKTRLSDPRNRPLFRKTHYVRNMTRKYISEDLSGLFAPLPERQAQRHVLNAAPNAA